MLKTQLLIDPEKSTSERAESKQILADLQRSDWLFFKADMMSVYPVGKVVLHERIDGCCTTRLSNSEIRIGDSDRNLPGSSQISNELCYKTPPNAALVWEFLCSEARPGRFVVCYKEAMYSVCSGGGYNCVHINELTVYVIVA